MGERLTEAQARVLRRIADGEKPVYRGNIMFCSPEARYVLIFRSDHTVVQQRTLSALHEKGYFSPGYVITDEGRAALKARSD
jgi:hypothetical protein